MNLKIEVRGVSDSIRKVETDYRDFLERVADTILTEAPKFTPKRTGRAAAGWEKKMEKDNFTVENRVPYVGYLEKPYVKSKQAPRGIIGPTLTSVKGKIK
jgi:hypothetical protein